MAKAGEDRHPASLEPGDLLAECDQKFTRRSGPGGQNRNKVETAVILRHRPSGISAEASERRTQGDNRDVALGRLRRNLALSVRRPVGEGGPSPLWRSRCRGGRVSINPEHPDYPALLAEAMDALHELGYETSRAAEYLACTSSQLLKLLKMEPRALRLVNKERQERDLRPML